MSDKQKARIWDDYIPESDKEILNLAGYSQQIGFGDRPAFIVIDVNFNFTGDKPEPIKKSIEQWPNSCGEAGWKAIPYINLILETCHRKGVPVFLATDDFRSDGWNLGSWRWKTRRISEERENFVKRNLDGSAIHQELSRQPSDIIIRKLKPSAFNGTALRQLLTLLRVDTLIVAGTTTSGCVRATTIDAFSDNFRVVIPEEACFDRVEVSHAINLFDMNAKYADVLATSEVISKLEEIPKNLFELPTGSP